LIDDFDKKGELLSHYLKIWADCYSFNAEIKGSTISPNVSTFIITSQYTIEELFHEDSHVVEALERRFKTTTIIHGNKLVAYPVNWQDPIEFKPIIHKESKPKIERVNENLEERNQMNSQQRLDLVLVAPNPNKIVDDFADFNFDEIAKDIEAEKVIENKKEVLEVKAEILEKKAEEIDEFADFDFNAIAKEMEEDEIYNEAIALGLNE
jgi:hypothetical protein